MYEQSEDRLLCIVSPATLLTLPNVAQKLTVGLKATVHIVACHMTKLLSTFRYIIFFFEKINIEFSII